MFASIDSIAISHTKSHFTPNLRFSEGACGTLEECSQVLGDLMSQHWHLSRVDRNLRVNKWRNEAVASAVDK